MHQLTLFEGKKKSLSSSLKTRTVKNLFSPPCLNVSIQKKKKKKRNTKPYFLHRFLFVLYHCALSTAFQSPQPHPTTRDGRISVAFSGSWISSMRNFRPPLFFFSLCLRIGLFSSLLMFSITWSSIQYLYLIGRQQELAFCVPWPRADSICCLSD